MLDQSYVVAFLATLGTVIMAVMLQYESFIVFGRMVRTLVVSHRPRILLLLFGLISVHVVEVWVFGITAWWLAEIRGIGSVLGYETLSFLDYIFMSAVTYTTLGYGDMVPVGPIRFLYGTQALVGFTLITWSASFTFLEMQRNWDDSDR